MITIGGHNAIGPGTLLGERIVAGIADECARHDLEHVVEYVNVLENRQGFINTENFSHNSCLEYIGEPDSSSPL